jgi:uncharacterized YigZ family protein
MEIFSFKTVHSESESLFKEKGSKFLAFVYPVGNEDEVKQKLEALRKKYFDARHHCYAYMLGETERRFRANDDGEPNHSAGDPILGQIRSKAITNVMIVVVRYFGGVKLGVGGLIAAYKTAAEAALANNSIVEIEITDVITLNFDYASTADVMKLVSDFSMEILDQKFESDCNLELRYPIRHKLEIDTKVDLLIALGKVKRHFRI